MTGWTHGLINRLVILCDLAMILLAATVYYAIWHVFSWTQMGVLGLIGAAIYCTVMLFGSAYRVEHYSRARRQIVQVIVGLVPALLAIFLVYYALVPPQPGDPEAFGPWAALTLLALLFGRLVLVRAGVAWVNARKLLVRNTVVIGDLERAYALIERYRIDADSTGLLSFVGVFRDGGREASEAERAGEDVPPALGGIDELLEIAKAGMFDLVIVTRGWDDMRAIGTLARKLHRVATDVMVEMEPGVFSTATARVTHISDLPALQIQQRPLKGSLGLLKALEDYSIATIGLLVFSPVLLLAALAIKLDSPGPVLFRQARVGLNRREFMVYKLRTMRFDPRDDGSIGAVRSDPRITRVGGLLRSLSIDEIPQLLNVLRGEMSVVGPRPHVPNMLIEDKQYEAISDYVARYRMKPGITGWAQINGMRGGIHTVEKAARGVELDLYYIENWSIWFDIRIILLTMTKGLADTSAF